MFRWFSVETNTNNFYPLAFYYTSSVKGELTGGIRNLEYR